MCFGTCVCFVQVALQAAHVGGFKGAELALEGLVVPVVRLHVSVQTGEEKRREEWNERRADEVNRASGVEHPSALMMFFTAGRLSAAFQRRSILFTSQTTSAHFPVTTEQRAVGGTHLPTIPWWECVRACGDGGCVFNASLRGSAGMQLLSGSGHVQYRGITPGSSEEMRTLAFPSHSSVSVMDKTNHTTNMSASPLFARLSEDAGNLGND